MPKTKQKETFDPSIHWVVVNGEPIKWTVRGKVIRMFGADAPLACFRVIRRIEGRKGYTFMPFLMWAKKSGEISKSVKEETENPAAVRDWVATVWDRQKPKKKKTFRIDTKAPEAISRDYLESIIKKAG